MAPHFRMTAFAVALVLGGCAATPIRPPPAPPNPVTAAVLDHGRHSSLLLEMPDGSMVRYAYGEWGWYAMGRTGGARALGALFTPTRAALGRRTLPGPLTPDTARGQVKDGVEDVLLFEVDSRRAVALADRLDRLFQAGGEKRMVYNSAFD